MRSLFIPALLLGPFLQAQTSVLFIGNSYTYVNDLPNTFRELALSMGETVTVASSAPGGYTFEAHSTYAPTLDAIASQAWSHVVLQEQSQRPSFPQEQVENEVFPFAEILVDAIRANDVCSRPVFYMTWGRQNGDADNCDFWPPVCTFDGMNELLHERYVQMGEDNDAYVSPVGAAWKQVRETHPFINLYQGDGSHPSVEGTYLAACVFYATLFRESCAGASFVSSLQPDTAAILQAIASAVVLDDVAAWNLDVNDVDAFPTGSSSTDWGQLTYTHGGPGTHLWTSSDGQSFTSPDATFFFPTEGAYTFTHTYTDPCGYTDTDTWEWLVSITGIEEAEFSARGVISPARGTLEVIGKSGDVLIVTDPRGRVIVSQQLDGDRVRVSCVSGLHLYRITDRNAVSWTGRIVVE